MTKADIRGRHPNAQEVQFVQLVALGRSARAALVEAFPEYEGKATETTERQGARLVVRLRAEIERAKREAAARIEERYTGLKDEIVDRLVRAIREATDADPLAVVEYVPAIRQLSSMLGWDAPKNVTVRDGGRTADFAPSPLAALSDAEIMARLEELRGA